MRKLKIYISNTDKSEPIEKALRIMTDDWIDDGNSCLQTVIDLRDAVEELLDWKKRVEVAANEVIDYHMRSMHETVPKQSILRLEKELGE
jgi:hypothetical protein